MQDVIDGASNHDIIKVSADINAKVGHENHDYERVVGKHGLGLRNAIEERLYEICSMNELGTLFRHRTIHKATWVSLDGKTGNHMTMSSLISDFGIQ